MKPALKTFAAPLLAAGLLMGCQAGEKETLGTLIGAGLGAWAGSSIGHGDGRVVATAMGTMIGAGLGNAIGKNMDKVDRMEMARAQHEAFEYMPSGQESEWYNPDSGNSGWVRPEPSFRDERNQYCREFQQTVTIGGETEKAYGTACRRPDGSWEIISG